MAARKYSGPERVKVRGASPPDPDEAQALDYVVSKTGVSEAICTNVISAWIGKRAELCAASRLCEELAFDLGDSKLRGAVAAALPAIGSAINVPADVAFYALSKDQIIDVFTLAYQAIEEAAVSLEERPVTSLKTLKTGDAEVPF